MREVRIEWTEFRSPKPCVESSILSAPAIKTSVYADFRIGTFLFVLVKRHSMSDPHIFPRKEKKYNERDKIK